MNENQLKEFETLVNEMIYARNQNSMISSEFIQAYTTLENFVRENSESLDHSKLIKK